MNRPLRWSERFRQLINIKRTASVFLALLFFSTTPIFSQINLEVTEIFPGQAGADLTADWFEIKNTGSTAWVSGTDPNLYYDDESISASDADLINGITDIQPGEYVIVLITNSTADISTFNNVWSPVIDLTGIEVGYTDGAGQGGGGDAVALWIGDPTTTSPVDTATYPNTVNNDGQSFDVEIGSFSTVGNDNDAVQTLALGGSAGTVPNIGSPGNQGPPVFDPNAPIIQGDSIVAAPYLQIRFIGSSFLSSDINDPTDPASTLGIPLILSDADNPLDSLTLSAVSSNQTVIPDANLTLSGTGANRILSLNPIALGYASIALTVTDPDGKTGTYALDYAVSDATQNTNSSRFHGGASDGSTAIEIDANHMWVADDEDQTIRLYNRGQSGLALTEIDFNNSLGSTVEIDIEGSFRNGNMIFWIGSHTDSDREVIFSTLESGAGSSASLSFMGSYTFLVADLEAWDANNGHGLGANYLGLSSGFEIEALSSDPNNPNGALLGFRGPLVNGNAIIVPVSNFQSIVSMNPSPGSASFGTPVELGLQGRTLRSMSCSTGGCLIIAGPSGPVSDFRLLTWDGNPTNAPEFRAANLSVLANTSSFEGIVSVPSSPFTGSAGDAVSVQLIVDTGTFDYYGDGTEAKDLPNAEWKKFRSELVVLDSVQTPALANQGDVVITEILQNPSNVSDALGEWFELYNATVAPIDLSGWLITDNDSDSHTIDSAAQLIIPAGGYVVLAREADSAVNGGVDVDYVYDNVFLGNGTDELVLTTPDGVEVDRVEWDNGATFPDPNGATMSLLATNLDNNVGANWCTAVTPFGAGDLGTPGSSNDCVAPPSFDLQITEIWPGQSGADLTADWFEITNFGALAWVGSQDPDLYYDDESQDPALADPINGITDIQPGESVIIMIGDSSSVPTFSTVWSPDYDLIGIEIGWSDGAGIGQSGDAVTLFVGAPDPSTIVDYEIIPAGGNSGVSYDVVLGAFSQQGAGTPQIGSNVAAATTATSGTNGTEPAIGSPGNQGPLNIASSDLIITEIFPGQEGDDLTADWFEIENIGTQAWVSGVDPVLYYDDDSADPAVADSIMGINEILPGARAIVLITDNPADITTFTNVWGPVIDLTGVEIGYADGSGLGGGGDAVTLWQGDPNLTNPIDTASYPDTDGFDGQSYDVGLTAFSVIGNNNGAVQTIAQGGINMEVPNIGSPGNGLGIPPNLGLKITEIFPGQEGDDLTADWFEIKNTGTTPWIAGDSPPLYYDDESADPTVADSIIGVTEILPGRTAIVLITSDVADISTFIDVWGAVLDLTAVDIGYVDGAGLGGGGDAVTLWLGNPNTTLPQDTASYPDTAPFDGQSYDVELGEFSVVGNLNNAVATIAQGGINMDIPNIGSPGNGRNIAPVSGLVITEIFPGQLGDDLTADWFEIKNTDTVAWESGVDADLYYDDESGSSVDADIIQGITDIQPKEYVIVLVTDDTADITTFRDVWGEVLNLNGLKIGYTDGAGLGGGGDAVTLWLGDPTLFTAIDTASYPDTGGFDGQSYDIESGAFSVEGTNGAVTTLALGGDSMNVANVGSPGNRWPVSVARSIDDRVKVYPNPTNDLLFIESEEFNLIETIKVLDLKGRVIKSEQARNVNNFEVDFSGLPRGLYILQLSGDEGKAIRRINKQ